MTRVQFTIAPPERSFFFTLLVVALLTSKFLHLFSHVPAVPIFLFLLYFPTLVLPDVFVICISRVIFQRSRVFGFILSAVIASAAAAQIGLFIETGGELRWSMLGKVVREPEGFFGMLMSGFLGLAATIGVLLAVTWVLNPSLYNISYRAVKAFLTTIWPQSSQRCFEIPAYSAIPEDDGGDWSDSVEDVVDEKQAERSKFRALRWARLKLFVVTVILVVLHAVRPKAPFGHMATTLPFTIFEGLFSKRSAFCDPSPWDGPEGVPFPDLTEEKFWIPPAGEKGGVGRGWKPGTPWWKIVRDIPGWLPEEEVEGFGKWYRKAHHNPDHPSPPPSFAHGAFPDARHPPPPSRPKPHHKGHGEPHPPPPPLPPPPPGYESILDPLKISNANQPLMDSLHETLKQGNLAVPIKHVVLMTLESTRKDVFPLMKDGLLYKKLEESRGESLAVRDDDDEWADLSELSPNADLLTGEDSHFERVRNMTHGGINIEGALTGSTYTLKSLLGSHCGVAPLPVDFLEELESEIYQPCLPQILNIMNKQNISEADDTTWPWKNATWKSVFMQGSTNKLDRQKAFMEQMGFDETVVREDLQNPNAKYPAKNPELNYFGYSEKELKPYMHDLFTTAEKNNERVFLSHLTTSTHHPWATPKEFGEQQNYWGDSRGHHSPWDRYLNSIKWADHWIGEVLSLLEEVGVADETLIVILGDHGFSFSDDSSSKTTYANSHINSFRIPMVFRHPSLPRIQINATVTSLSILPTILDLLATSGSLSAPQTTVAKYLIPEYEGQSLIRTFLPTLSGRQAWNFGVVNPGGTHLSIVSSAHPYRLVLPICEQAPYTFSDLARDPMEEKTVKDWEGGKKLRMQAKLRYGAEAGEWVSQAEKVGAWWVWEARRRWGYWEGTRRMDRGVKHLGDGFLENDHWWDT